MLEKIEKNVQLETTSLCNLHCDICPHSKLHEIVPRETMSAGLFDLVLSSLENVLVNRLVMSGLGEPFLDRSIIKRMVMAHETLNPVGMEIYTNATVMGPYLDDLAALPFPVQIVAPLHYLDAGELHERTGAVLSTVVDNIRAVSQQRQHRLRVVSNGRTVGDDTAERIRDLLNIPYPYEVFVSYPNNRAGLVPDLPYTHSSLFRDCYRAVHWLHLDVRGGLVLCCNDFLSCSAVTNVENRNFKEVIRALPYHVSPYNPIHSLCAKCDRRLV